jgi:ferritin-like metal-binding protein YciE
MPELNERDTKLTQWLGEAHAKEAELEADLTAHIALTQKAAYKKRLQQHLKETREHKRRVASRIKKLGGTPTDGRIPGVPGPVSELAGKALATAKGQVGAARAAVTAQAETHLRNAQEELREEHVEIALYTRIEALATEVGDRETAQLAKSIRRDEERMAKFLDAELRRLVKDVVRASIPRDQRPTTRKRRRSTSASSRSSSSKSRGTTSSRRSTSSSSSRRSGSSSSARRSGSSSSSRRSGPSRSRQTTGARS